MTAGEIDLRPLAEAASAAEQVIDDYVRTGAVAWGEDLAATVEPLRGAIRLGRMDGWVACRGECGLGLAVCLERAGRQNHAAHGSGRLSFVHLLAACPEEDLAGRLVGHMVTRLRAAGFRHIASQAGLVAHQEAIHQAFTGLGFRAIERMVLSAGLAEEPQGGTSRPGYDLIAWDDEYLEQAAQLFYDANRDTVDALVYPQFRIPEETRRMVQAVRDGGAGAFVEAASGFVLCGGVLCGAIMLVRPGPAQGFVVIIAVAPARQGQGIGRALLSRALRAAWEAGIRAVDLTVTEENRPAMALYRRLGFVVKRRMTAYVWEAT